MQKDTEIQKMEKNSKKSEYFGPKIEKFIII
jgi:hypothetical protein